MMTDEEIVEKLIFKSNAIDSGALRNILAELQMRRHARLKEMSE
jgi:hypothetical protein